MKLHCFFVLAVFVSAILSLPPLLSAQPSLDPLWFQGQPMSGGVDMGLRGLYVDSSGNMYTAGAVIEDNTGYDYEIVKCSATGTILWHARFDSLVHDVLKDIAVDAAGNVFVTGNCWGMSSPISYLTLKYNTQGRLEWSATYSGPMNNSTGWAIAVDNEVNSYVTGYSNGPGYNNEDIATIKYSPQGQQLWEARYHSTPDYNDVGRDVVVDMQGNVYVTGYSLASLITLKYNTQGVLQWAAYHNTSDTTGECGSYIVVDDQSNVYVTGCNWVDPDYGPGTVVTLKYNPLGQQQWVNVYDSPYENALEFPSGLALDAAGNVFVAGTNQTFLTGNHEFWVVKYNPAGVQQWTHDGSTPPGVRGMAVDETGNVYLTGWVPAQAPRNLKDCFTWKYSPQGNLLWTARFGGLATYEWGENICLDHQNNVLVAGGGYRPHQGYILFLKYNQALGNASIDPPAVSLTCSPNPFNPSTVIRYKIQDAGYVSLKIFDTMGRLVVTLADGWQEVGTRMVTFDGSKLPSGLYFVRMQAGDVSAVQKVMLLK
jgi:hypothetical protein